MTASAGVRSVDTAIKILVAFSGADGPQKLKDIAERAHMHPAKVHRYLVSCVRQGLVRQETDSGAYSWGPVALDFGASAARGNTFVRIATEAAAALRDDVNVTVAVAVWGNHGPTHVYVEESRKQVVVKTQLGSVLPLVSSATGKIFAAFMPPAMVKSLLDAEFANLNNSNAASVSRENFEVQLDRVRSAEIAQALGEFSPGIHALCVPVFSQSGTLAGALTLLAPAGQFDPNIDGAAANSLKQAAERVSRGLGWHRKT